MGRVTAAAGVVAKEVEAEVTAEVTISATIIVTINATVAATITPIIAVVDEDVATPTNNEDRREAGVVAEAATNPQIDADHATDSKRIAEAPTTTMIEAT